MAIVEKQMADMKTNMRYTIALMGAIVALTGCVKENLEETIKVREGDEIVFGARAGYENNSPNTKTIYKGKGSYYTIGEGDNQKTMEAVHWLPGDKVMIYCDQGQQTAHYQVTATGTGDATEAETSLQKMQLHGVGNNGIQWKNIKENDHTFYAIYPSPYQFSTPNVESDLLEASKYQERIKCEGTQIDCYLPNSQAPSRVVNDNGNYIAYPNMDYAYMIAKQTVQSNQEGRVPAGVDLDFRPIVTALEVTMTVPVGYTTSDGSEITYDDLTISNVRIEETKGNPIVGPFSLDLKEYEYSDKELTYPNVSIPSSQEVLNSVSVQLYEDINGIPTPITIESGKTVTFTVFMLPVDIKNLQIAVDLKKGSLGDLEIKAHKKQFLINLELPANSNIKEQTTGSNWISQLPDNVLVEGLSIPGTANSFSYAYPGKNTNEDPATGNNKNEDAKKIANNFMTQTLSFENQWNMGIRCFELVCDRQNSTSTNASLANEKLRCNNSDLGVTVTEAFDMVIDKLLSDGNEDEFAMIIITYQPQGGGNAARNPIAFMNQLKTFYKNYIHSSGKQLDQITSLYKPGLTIGSLREAPLMIVARPSQEGEDENDGDESWVIIPGIIEGVTEGTYIDDAIAGSGYNILTVKGWGSLPDKWYKRGYDCKMFRGVGGTTGRDLYEDRIDAHSNLSNMEDWIYGPNHSGTELNGQRNPIASRPKKGNTRYDYSSDQGYTVWAQEWRRIHTIDPDILDLYVTNDSNDQWFESYKEKQNDIIDCLVKSIAGSTNTVYFNSLDGFYITNQQDSYDHYWRGNMGNIGAYAEDINAWFFPELLKYSATGVTGPLGVIIMDRVAHDGPGSLLPEVIYMNNWRHTLDTAAPAN